MEISLNNKNILLTGASRGIGKAIALGLGKSGARVALHYNLSDKMAIEIAKKTGNGSFAIKADLENAENAIELFNSVQKKWEGSTSLPLMQPLP